MGKIESKFKKGDEVHIKSATGFNDPYVAKVTKIKVKKDQYTGKDYNVIMVKGGSYREDTGAAVTGSDSYYLGEKVGAVVEPDEVSHLEEPKSMGEEAYKPVDLKKPQQSKPSGFGFAMNNVYGVDGVDEKETEKILAKIKEEESKERKRSMAYTLDQIDEHEKMRALKAMANESKNGSIKEYFHPDVHKAAHLLSRIEDDEGLARRF